MNTPVIIICGGAGSGKDTVAGFIAAHKKAALVAQADPMKRFAAQVFGFTEEQLWGPSECRNAVDTRYDSSDQWAAADAQMGNVKVLAWLREVLPTFAQAGAIADPSEALGRWFVKLAEDHGVLWMNGRPTQPNKQLTARYMLQTLGTEWGRTVRPAMWNEYGIDAAYKLLEGGYIYTRTEGLQRVDANRATPGVILKEQTQGYDYSVITDGRFRNEILNVKRQGGYAIRVVNPKGVDKLTAGVEGHRSEAELSGIPDHFFDAIIMNDKSKGLIKLENSVAAFIEKLSQPYLVPTYKEGGMDSVWP